jgi:capsular polysaccharide biosynthesis protein
MGSGLPESLWVHDDLAASSEYPPAEVTGGLASLKFLTTAIRRRARLWCTTAAIGLLACCAYYVISPPSFQASTSLLLQLGPYENVTTVQNDDQAMAQTRAVAALALQKLGLKEDPGTFLGSYTVVPVTERVLKITVTAPSSALAVQRANAVASAFLDFRAHDLRAAQKLVLASLNQQVSQAQQQLNLINSQISQLPGSLSPSYQAEVKRLNAKKTSQEGILYNLQQAVTSDQTTIQPETAAAVQGSAVLDAAYPLPRSRIKPLLTLALGGLLGGLAIGIAIVVLQALVSDRLRRRDDVAQALGAAVGLSVRSARGRWWAPWRARRPATSDRDVDRIAGHLGRLVAVEPGSIATLAVIPADDMQVPARSLTSLAVSLAQDHKRVVVADLCAGAPAAKLLGAGNPGVSLVAVQDTRLTVATPEPDDVAPIGPRPRRSPQPRRTPFADAVADACASADILLTLATLDPALGGDHLPTWAASAVAMVTTGRSSPERIHGVGEMIRLSGTRLASAVLIGADAADESLGTSYTPETV